MAFSLNPATDKFQIEIDNSIFTKELSAKYNNYLKASNSPFKDIKSVILESIQNIEIPGINLNLIAVPGLMNLGDLKPSQMQDGFPHTTIQRQYPGTASQNEIIDGVTLNLTLRNTIINWMYFYEVLYSYYKRTRETNMFYVIITMLDAAEIPLIEFKFSDCFVSVMPGLSFAYNTQFRESKTIDVGITFNKFDVKFLFPGFNTKKVNLK